MSKPKTRRAAALRASAPSKKKRHSKRICGGDYLIIPRDVILPFRPNVFGLLCTDYGGDRVHISIYDPELLHEGVRAVIVWADRSKLPQFGTLHRYSRRYRKEHVELLQMTGTQGEYGPQSFTLGQGDVLAGEIGVFWPHIQIEMSDCLYSTRFLEYVANDQENEAACGFQVQRPDNLRMGRNWDELYVNPAVGLTEGRHAVIWKGPREIAVGKVQNLVQAFSMVDKITGKEIVFGPKSPAHWVAGPITGMARGCGEFRDGKRREFAGKYPTAQDVGVLAPDREKRAGQRVASVHRVAGVVKDASP